MNPVPSNMASLHTHYVHSFPPPSDAPAGTVAVRYKDTLAFCGLTAHLSFDAVSRKETADDQPGGLWYAETHAAGTHVLHEYEVRPSRDGKAVDIVDRVLVECGWLLRAYVTDTARNAHLELLRKLPEYFAKWQQANGGGDTQATAASASKQWR